MTWMPSWPNGIGHMGTERQPNLPARLTTREVCELGRISPVTLWRRRRAGIYKLTPCDRGRELLYLRDEVLCAFGMASRSEPRPEAEEWAVDPEAIRAVRARMRSRGRSGG